VPDILQTVRTTLGHRLDPRRISPGHLRRRLELEQTIRVTVACGVAWVVAQRLLNVPLPVMAPLAALLTLQVTLYRTLTQGLRLVAGVLVGLMAALSLAGMIGVNVVTLTASVFVSLFLGRLMRLGDMVNQVALTAMFVIGLGQQAGFARIYDSLIGIAAGMLVNAFSSSRRDLKLAGARLAGFCDEEADLCGDMAARVRASDWDADTAGRWLHRARAIGRDTDALYEAVDRAEEGLRVSPRRGELRPSVRRIGEAASSLDRAARLHRVLIRRLSEPAAAVAGSMDQPADLSQELRDLLAGLFDDLSEAFTVFGRIQSDPTGTGQVDELRAILRRAEDRQHCAGDSLEASTRPGPERSLVALLDDARRILKEMDPDHGPRQEALTA
jgi:uncharacterized membrane protein YgaE (UPF0421/DUF939 family)